MYVYTYQYLWCKYSPRLPVCWMHSDMGSLELSLAP